jgi:UPF0148 protein
MSGTRYSRNQDVVKKMADLLRAGATMLSERCPICGLPLFRLKSGEVICPVHGRVYIVRTESEVTRVTVQGVLENLEKIAAEEIARLMEKRSEDLGTLREWLDVLERTERILSIMRGKEQEESGKEKESTKAK